MEEFKKMSTSDLYSILEYTKHRASVMMNMNYTTSKDMNYRKYMEVYEKAEEEMETRVVELLKKIK